MAKKYLTKNDILSTNDLKRVEIYVPQWGGSVLIQSFTADVKDYIESQYIKISAKSGVGIRALYVGKSLIDATGRRLFDDDELVALGTKHAAAVDVIFDGVSKLNRISPQDVDELEKNLNAAIGGDSPSDSA